MIAFVAKMANDFLRGIAFFAVIEIKTKESRKYLKDMKENFLLFYSLKVFYIRISWWFSTGVSVTASLLKSPGLFSVFWPISTML